MSWLKRIGNYFVYKKAINSTGVESDHQRYSESQFSNNQSTNASIKIDKDEESEKNLSILIDLPNEQEKNEKNSNNLKLNDETMGFWNFIHADDKYEDIIDMALSEIIFLIMNERNSCIVCTRLGLVDGEPKTLQEVGDEFGVTRERIRQIEAMFYRRLRYYSCKDSTYVYCNIKNLQSIFNVWISPEDNTNPFYVASMLQRLNKMHYLRLIITLFYDSKESEQIEKEYRSIIKEIFLLQKKVFQENNNQKKNFIKLLNDVAWPETTRRVDTTKLQLVKPKRLANRDNGHITGEFFSQKNKQSIEYESNLEYKFCMYLESLNEVKGYVQQPVKIPYTMNGFQKYYYPDFLVTLEDSRCLLVEIKPRSHMVQYQNLLKYIALQKYCMSKGYGYLIAENYYSINKLINHQIDNTKLEKLNKKINEKPIKWLQFKPMMRELCLTHFETNALVLHGNLKLTTAPFIISFSDVSFQEFIKLHKGMMASTSKSIPKEDSFIREKPGKINKDNIAKKNQVRGRPLNDYSRWTKEERGREETAIDIRLNNLKKEKSNTKVSKSNKEIERPNNSHSKWTSEEEELLVNKFNYGMSIKQISELHERKEGGIRARLVKLGLIEKND